MALATQYFENAAAQEIFQFQVRSMCHVCVSEPVQGTQGLHFTYGLEYGERCIKGVCKGVK